MASIEKSKMPVRISALYKQIMEHPEYKTKLDGTTRWAFEAGCVGGGSWCTKQNNAWSREIWKHLYWDEDPKRQFAPKIFCDTM